MQIAKHVRSLFCLVAAIACMANTPSFGADSKEKIVIDITHPYMYGRSSTLIEILKAVVALCGMETEYFAYGQTQRGSRKLGKVNINSSNKDTKKIFFIDEAQLFELGKDNIGLFEYAQKMLNDGYIVVINRLTLLSNDKPWEQTENAIKKIRELSNVTYHTRECNFSTCAVCKTRKDLGSRLVIVDTNNNMRFDCEGGKKADNSCGEKEYYITICRSCQKECTKNTKASESLLKLFNASTVEKTAVNPVEVKADGDNVEFVCSDHKTVQNWANIMNELLKNHEKNPSEMMQHVITVCSYIGIEKETVIKIMQLLDKAINAALKNNTAS